MSTAIKYNVFDGMDKATQLKTLVGAIDFELKKAQLCLDMCGQKAIANLVPHSSVKAANDVTFDQIKSFLANKYATSSDNPHMMDVANQMEQFYHTNMPELDMGFALLFDLIDLRNSTHDHFDILDTNAGLSWNQRKPGEKTKIRRNINEAKATVDYAEFSDGIGILDAWLDFNQWWKVDDVISEFRATYYDKMADLHYGLLTAIGSGIEEAFDTDDATTANKAAATILRNMRGKGRDASQSSGFYAVCAPEHVGRLEKLLTAQRGSAIVDQGTVKQPLAYRIQGIISTTKIPAASSGWYLVLPGRKNKRGLWKDLTVESKRDIEHSARDLVGVGRYNAAIGDTDQIRRCLFS